ncbi:MAG: alpha/beta fold hydrolase [Gammaproteobacteria bacterium]
MSEDGYREEYVELATGKIHLLRGGSGSALVVLHHSWGSPGWTPFYDHLARQFDVIVPDMPGYGGSERPAWAREPRDLAIIVSNAMERLDLTSSVVIGLGFGGYVAAELATMSPSGIGRLVLVGAAGLKPEEGQILDQMMVSHTDYIKQSFRDEAAFADIIGEPDQELRQLWDFSREMTARVTWKPYMESHPRCPSRDHRRRRASRGDGRTGSCSRSRQGARSGMRGG